MSQKKWEGLQNTLFQATFGHSFPTADSTTNHGLQQGTVALPVLKQEHEQAGYAHCFARHLQESDRKAMMESLTSSLPEQDHRKGAIDAILNVIESNPCVTRPGALGGECLVPVVAQVFQDGQDEGKQPEFKACLITFLGSPHVIGSIHLNKSSMEMRRLFSQSDVPKGVSFEKFVAFKQEQVTRLYGGTSSLEVVQKYLKGSFHGLGTDLCEDKEEEEE